MMTKKHFHKAFTLAEVLITLGVIGVVAALTIPVLMNYAFERQAVSAVKKDYAVISAAWLKWQEDKNCASDNVACLTPGTYNAWMPLLIAKELAPYLKYQEVYHNPQATALANIDWVPTKVTKMDNNLDGGPSFVVSKAACSDMVGSIFLLQDGTALAITSDYGPDAEFPKIILFTFDINGSRKPNRVGKDQFIIATDRHGIVPYYYSYWGAWTSHTQIDGLCNQASGTPCTSDSHSPVAHILTYDRLPDLKSMGYPNVP